MTKVPMIKDPAAQTRGKIMVVDDNPIIQRAIYFALRDHGYKVVMSGAVYDAIGIIREERPDLIFVDLSFPPDPTSIGGPMADGFFFIHWIRRTPEIEKLPVVIVSGTEPDKYQEQITNLEVKACLHKPVDKEGLLATVQAVLGGRAASDELEPS